jgi:hypothetical protein
VKKLSAFLANTRNLTLYARGMELMAAMELLKTHIHAQHLSSPWLQYMPENRREATQIFIQAGRGQTRPRAQRPGVSIGSNLSFSSWEEYTIALGMAV